MRNWDRANSVATAVLPYPFAMPYELGRLADQFMHIAKQRKLTLVTAESCTAGLLAQTMSDAPGSAEHFQGGFVTYTKAQKTVALGVSATILQAQGAVCAEVARQTAQGALCRSAADLSVAITGVAGPEPDEDGNPVGSVCIAVVRRGVQPQASVRDYGALGREEIRRRAAADAIEALIDLAMSADESM
jgi:nicotinamide-nucleotide amidase